MSANPQSATRTQIRNVLVEALFRHGDEELRAREALRPNQRSHRPLNVATREKRPTSVKRDLDREGRTKLPYRGLTVVSYCRPSNSRCTQRCRHTALTQSKRGTTDSVVLCIGDVIHLPPPNYRIRYEARPTAPAASVLVAADDVESSGLGVDLDVIAVQSKCQSTVVEREYKLTWCQRRASSSGCMEASSADIITSPLESLTRRGHQGP